jgi:hypothetical protein
VNKIDQPDLTKPQRWAGLYTVVLMLLLLAFFIIHQVAGSAFFTGRFGRAEMLALYGPIILSLAPPIQRLVQGKRNPARPLEAVTDFSLALGSLWLWIHYPFDFAHVADIFRPDMRFAFSWLTNNIARFILILQVVLGFISGLATIVTYFRGRPNMNMTGATHEGTSNDKADGNGGC